ncbi:unnamed protein product [Effrenium voratum]|nr:unnamed protein product [Effrenium voratum]
MKAAPRNQAAQTSSNTTARRCKFKPMNLMVGAVILRELPHLRPVQFQDPMEVGSCRELLRLFCRGELQEIWIIKTEHLFFHAIGNLPHDIPITSTFELLTSRPS